MNKVFRSLAWAGAVSVALAACGDDVTVTEPPPPPPPPVAQVRSVTVTPDNVSVSAGSTIQMSANVTADAGATVTVAWTTSDATRATVSTSGLVTIPSAAAPGAVSIKATATAGTSTASGAATLNVVGTTISGVTVVPSTANLTAGTANNSAQSLTAVAIVAGTNSPPQSVTWTSLDESIATVSAAGVVTANSSAKSGTVNIQACSTVDASKCGFLALTVGVPSPALIQIGAVTFNNGTNNVPVNLLNVFGQIEISLNIDNGDRVITRVDALIGGQVVASQSFSAASKAKPAPSLTPTTVILSTNTAQLRKNGSTFLPVVFNGNNAITANLYILGSSTPIVSNAVPVVMDNPDAIVASPGATLVATNQSPSVVVGGNTFFTGSLTVTGLNYIAFSKNVPVSVTVGSTVCGPSANLVPTGATTAQTGIALTGIFDCAGFEGAAALTTEVTVDYAVGAVGPDGTPITPPTTVNTVGSAFQVPINAAGDTEPRWNMISGCEFDSESGVAAAKGAKGAKPVVSKSKASKVKIQAGTPSCPSFLGPVFIDNLGPSVSLLNVAFNDLFDQPWINAAYLFSQDLSAVDNGSGLAALVAHDFVGLVCTGTVVTSGADYAETVTSNSTDGHQICAVAVDALGNTTTTGPSNFFGVDFGAPGARIAGTTAATPTLLPATPAGNTVSTTPNTTIFSIAAPFPATDVWGLEGLDTRSGFNQNVVPGYPAVQTLSRLAPIGPTSCTLFTNAMGILLSDTWVRTNVNVPIDCNLQVGYYNYAGYVVDRAGNQSPSVSRNFAVDQYAVPNITGLGFATQFYTPGQPAPFGFSANDDLEVIDATVAVTQAIPTGGTTILRYPFGGLTPLGIRWDAILTNIVNGAQASIPYFLFRVDESCTGAGAPYPSCPAVGTASAPAGVPATAPYYLAPVDKNSADYPLGPAGLPTNVSANVSDVAGQTAATAINAPLLVSQFNPSTGISEQWSGYIDPVTQQVFGAGADLLSWSASTVGGVAVAVHVASTSIVVPYFDGASLWRLNNAAPTEWVYCAAFPAPVLTDNGSNRFWTYSLTEPTAGPCTGSTFSVGPAAYRVMGTKNGAGLFTPTFP
ncbi:MAG: Ig-like domain-containing protein [Gemmatimonadota bacterium]